MSVITPHGLHHVTAIASDPQRNVDFYTRVLGLRLVKRTVNFDAPDSWHLYYGDERGRPASLLTFFPWPDVPRGALVDVTAGASTRGLQAGGTVHHVAYRAPDLATMQTWRRTVSEAGVSVTEILDRQYFRSIYFREPGGVLFEIATDAPGFDIDEPLLELGRSLRLPPWLEPSREQIEAALPPLEPPDRSAGPTS